MGVDVGTTKIAVLLLNTETRKVETVHTVPNASEITDAQGKAKGWSEWSAEKVAELTFKAIAKVAAHSRSKQVKAIGVTGQMHGTVLVSHDGQAVTPFIGWQDRRCDENVPGENFSYISRMVDLAGEHGFQREGCKPATGYMGSTLFWLKENHALPSKPVTACFLPDYIVMRMTGQPPVTDPTNAGSSGIFDVTSRKWDLLLVQKLGIPSELLPEVKKSGEPVGELAKEAAEKTGLPQGTPVCVACGDNQASFLGSVSNRQVSVLVNVGTGGQISLWVPEYIKAKNLETRCYLDESYLLVGAELCGGRSYALLQRFFLEVGRAFFGAKTTGELYQTMTRLASKVPSGSDGLICEPLFAGTRWDSSRRAAWLGVNEMNFTPGHFARSLLEGVAARFKALYDSAVQAGLSPRNFLVGSGNAVRKNFLLAEILSETFGMPLQVPVNVEEAAFGAALLSAVGCRRFPSVDEAARLVEYSAGF